MRCAETSYGLRVEIRLKNMVREGDVMRHYYGETAKSCALDRCLERTDGADRMER